MAKQAELRAFYNLIIKVPTKIGLEFLINSILDQSKETDTAYLHQTETAATRYSEVSSLQKHM